MVEQINDNLGGIFIDKNEQATKQSADFVNVYANNVHLSASMFDFSLTFGEVTEEKRGEQNVVNQKVRIILSKEMTKVLMMLLSENVKAYENEFGEIKIPTQTKPAKEQEVLASAARRKKK
jgi:hypothetical protein